MTPFERAATWPVVDQRFLEYPSVVQRPSWRTLAGVLAAALFGGTSCSDLPPSLPSTAAHVRNASRVDLVDLVIADRARAEKVRRLYADIEELMLTVKRTTAGQLVKLGVDDPPRTDAETRAVVAKVREADILAFKR